MIRRFGGPPAPGCRYILRHGVYAVLPRRGSVLVTVQEQPMPEVQLPGGGIDPGEGALPALHREVREETGWSIARPRRLGAFRRFTWMPDYEIWAEKLCHIYIARPVRRLGPPSEPCHQALWLDPAIAVGTLGTEGDAAFLRRALGRLARGALTPRGYGGCPAAPPRGPSCRSRG